MPTENWKNDYNPYFAAPIKGNIDNITISDFIKNYLTLGVHNKEIFLSAFLDQTQMFYQFVPSHPTMIGAQTMLSGMGNKLVIVIGYLLPNVKIDAKYEALSGEQKIPIYYSELKSYLAKNNISYKLPTYDEFYSLLKEYTDKYQFSIFPKLTEKIVDFFGFGYGTYDEYTHKNMLMVVEGIFDSFPTPVYLLLLILALAIKRKNKKALLLLTPQIAYLLSVLFFVSARQPRLVIPVFFCIPFLLLMVFLIGKTPPNNKIANK
jgi:hypothetical protein